MITVGEVISKVSFDDVFEEYRKHYEEGYERVMDIFQKLRESNPSPNYSNMVLFIRAIKENECGEDVVIDGFDCDDSTVFFDVCGEDSCYEGLYSITSSPYGELLGYFISDDTVMRFTSSQIIAHILWALDW